MTHTAGPWEFSSDGIWATSPWNARVKIATVTFFASMNAIDEKANGRLIAAAPDLLEAVEYLLSAHGEQIHDACDMAHKAVAKARGVSVLSDDSGAAS
jgi:hypothetical protein